MKNSGVEWLGEVPAHWEVRRLKYTCRMEYGDSPVSDVRQDGPVPVFGSNGCVGSHNTSNTEAPCIIVGRKGSFGKVHYSPVPTFAIDTTFFVDARVSSADIRWLYFMLGWLELDKVTKDSAVPGLDREDAYQRLAPLPPLTEQAAIVGFLDHADRRIRRYIRAKEMLIALLEEQKQAIIHQAVTGQINVRTGQPYPSYRSSGVEWWGKVPAHWEQRRLKQCVRTISKETTPSTEGREISEYGPVRFIKAENITSSGIVEYPSHFIDEETNDIIKRSKLNENDILFVIAGATLGKTSIVAPKVLPANINQAIAFIRPDKHIVPNYLALFLRSPRIEELTWLYAVQAAQPNLSMTNLGNFILPLPTIPEQLAITEYTESMLARCGKANDKARQEIALLREYRTRLIADVVTGKLDVREAAAALPEVDPLADDDDVGDGLGADETPAFDDDQEPAEVVG